MKHRTRAPRLPADERRALTVQTVLDLAAGQNPSDITTTDIARRMRMTQGALFRHFPTKDAIWQAVVEWVAARVLARLDEVVRTESPLEALKLVFMAHIETHARHAGVPRIVFGELQRAGDTRSKRMVRAFMVQYIGRLTTLIEEGKDRGEIDPGVDAKAAATLFVGMIQGLVVQSLVTGKAGSMRTKAPEILTIYLRGIRRTL